MTFDEWRSYIKNAVREHKVFPDFSERKSMCIDDGDRRCIIENVLVERFRIQIKRKIYETQDYGCCTE